MGKEERERKQRSREKKLQMLTWESEVARSQSELHDSEPTDITAEAFEWWCLLDEYSAAICECAKGKLSKFRSKTISRDELKKAGSSTFRLVKSACTDLAREAESIDDVRIRKLVPVDDGKNALPQQLYDMLLHEGCNAVARAVDRRMYKIVPSLYHRKI